MATSSSERVMVCDGSAVFSSCVSGGTKYVSSCDVLCTRVGLGLLK
jgi:hypothetical protein